MVELAAVTLAHQEHWSGPAGGWWPIFPIFWILFFVVAFWAFRRRGAAWHGRGLQLSGESVLDERYARGEISDQEYRERLEVLRSHRR